MTIAEKRTSQNNYLDSQAVIFGEYAELTTENDVKVADGGVKIYEDTNPNHKYPPVNK